MTDIVLYLFLGLVAGVFSGLIGVGGGIIIVPALILLFGMCQHQAQGTTLALLVPPIGLLAAWTYYKQGYVDLRIATFICIGFFLRGFSWCQACDSFVEPSVGEGAWDSIASHFAQDDIRAVAKRLQAAC